MNQQKPDIEVVVWLTLSLAAQKLSVSECTISRRAIRWQDKPVRYRVRYKQLCLDEGSAAGRRYYEPDLEAMVVMPSPLIRPYRHKAFRPDSGECLDPAA